MVRGSECSSISCSLAAPCQAERTATEDLFASALPLVTWPVDVDLSTDRLAVHRSHSRSRARTTCRTVRAIGTTNGHDAGVADVGLFVILTVASVGVIAAGLLSFTRMQRLPTFRERLPWFFVCMALVIAGFVVVVEWRCHAGWIDQDECHAWD